LDEEEKEEEAQEEGREEEEGEVVLDGMPLLVLSMPV